MPESEGTGDSALEDAVDDTDRMALGAPAEAPPDDEFEHLRAQPERRQHRRAADHLEYAPIAYGDGWGYPAPDSADHLRPFDAFNATTWHFKPPPPPWYRTRSAMVAIAAVTAAVVALVVSVVLLAFDGAPDVPMQETSTTPSTTTPSAAVTTTRSPLPPPPPPPPPPPSSAPVPSGGGQRVEPRPTKKPEIGVTRTPVTRNPISVSPQPRG